MSVLRHPVTDREQWLRDRRKTIGASEAAAALGMSPFESPRGLYLRKLGIAPEIEETEAMRFGTLLEPIIAAEYTRRTGLRIVEQQVHLSSESTPLSATLDGIDEEGTPVEFKTVGEWSSRSLGDEESDEVPAHWLIQGHQQMILSNQYRMKFAVLVAGQRFRLFNVERDEDLAESVIRGVRSFWDDHVAKRIPPASDKIAEARIMHLLYPGCEGGIELDDEAALIVQSFENYGAEERQARKLREELRGDLLERLGNHAYGTLPDGRVITRRIVEIGPATIERKGYAFTRINISKGPRN